MIMETMTIMMTMLKWIMMMCMMSMLVMVIVMHMMVMTSYFIYDEEDASYFEDDVDYDDGGGGYADYWRIWWDTNTILVDVSVCQDSFLSTGNVLHDNEPPPLKPSCWS